MSDGVKIGIYKIENPKGKIYIGQSTNIDNRLNGHKKLYNKGSRLLYNSLKEYGVESHNFSIIKLCSVDELNKWEIYYIKFFNSNNKEFGLNLTSGGQKYFYHSKETLEIMSKAQTGNTKTLGRVQSQEEIDKRVRKLKGQKRSPEVRKRMSESGKKKPKVSLKTREKLSKSLKYVNAKKVIDLDTNKIYLSAYDAAKEFGIKKSTLVARLNGQNINNTNLRYLDDVF